MSYRAEIMLDGRLRKTTGVERTKKDCQRAARGFSIKQYHASHSSVWAF